MHPASTASLRVASSSFAVMKMTGHFDPDAASRRCSSIPEIPPRWMSSSRLRLVCSFALAQVQREFRRSSPPRQEFHFMVTERGADTRGVPVVLQFTDASGGGYLRGADYDQKHSYQSCCPHSLYFCRFGRASDSSSPRDECISKCEGVSGRTQCGCVSGPLDGRCE